MNMVELLAHIHATSELRIAPGEAAARLREIQIEFEAAMAPARKAIQDLILAETAARLARAGLAPAEDAGRPARR